MCLIKKNPSVSCGGELPDQPLGGKTFVYVGKSVRVIRGASTVAPTRFPKKTGSWPVVGQNCTIEISKMVTHITVFRCTVCRCIIITQ